MARQLSPPVFHPGGVGRNFGGEELGYARMARVCLKHDAVYDLYIHHQSLSRENYTVSQVGLSLREL